MNGWKDTMRGHLGKRVEVTLTDGPDPVTVVGILHMFDNHGAVGVRTDDGANRWCWPNLRIRELP